MGRSVVFIPGLVGIEVLLPDLEVTAWVRPAAWQRAHKWRDENKKFTAKTNQNPVLYSPKL